MTQQFTVTIAVISLVASCLFIDGLLPNGSVSVVNACRRKTPDGKLSTINGYAYRPDDKQQGKLKVVFGGSGSGGDCK